MNQSIYSLGVVRHKTLTNFDLQHNRCYTLGPWSFTLPSTKKICSAIRLLLCIKHILKSGPCDLWPSIQASSADYGLLTYQVWRSTGWFGRYSVIPYNVPNWKEQYLFIIKPTSMTYLDRWHHPPVVCSPVDMYTRHRSASPYRSQTLHTSLRHSRLGLYLNLDRTTCTVKQILLPMIFGQYKPFHESAGWAGSHKCSK